MTILITSRTTELPGPELLIDCPKCTRTTPAKTCDFRETMGLFYIPLISQKERRVECNVCHGVQLAHLPFEELTQFTPQQLSAHLRPRVSIVVLILAIASVLTSWMPPVSLLLACAGLALSFRTGGLAFTISIVGLGLSLLFTIAYVALVMFA